MGGRRAGRASPEGIRVCQSAGRRTGLSARLAGSRAAAATGQAHRPREAAGNRNGGAEALFCSMREQPCSMASTLAEIDFGGKAPMR